MYRQNARHLGKAARGFYLGSLGAGSWLTDSCHMLRPCGCSGAATAIHKLQTEKKHLCSMKVIWTDDYSHSWLSGTEEDSEVVGYDVCKSFNLKDNNSLKRERTKFQSTAGSGCLQPL